MAMTLMLVARCSLLTLIGLLSAQALTQTGQWNGPIGQWLPAYQHSGVLPVAAPPGEFWPTSFQAINLAVIPPRLGAAATDVVIAWDFNWHDPAVPTPAAGWYQRYTVGNPEVPTSFKNRFVRIPRGPATPAEPSGVFLGDLFCSSQCWLPDGRLFIAGGNAKYASLGLAQDVYVPGPPFPSDSFSGSRYVGIWDPATADVAPSFGWTHIAAGTAGRPMRLPRWYPTVMVVSDRHVMVAGGQENTYLNWSTGQDSAYDTYELFDFSVNVMDWVREVSQPGQPPKLFDGPRGQLVSGQRVSLLGSYPRAHFLSNNRTFLAGMWGWSSSIDVDPSLPAHIDWFLPQSAAWSSPMQSGLGRIYGSSVLVPNVGNVPSLRDEVMILGGGIWPNSVAGDSRRVPAATATGWGVTQPLQRPRMLTNPVLAPNGDVVLIGGSVEYYWNTTTPTPELHTETWSRSSGWVLDARQFGSRMYHSTAGLLPTGNMVSAGGDVRTAIPGNQLADWEVYVPKYLTSGYARPQFAGSWSGPAPVDLFYAAPYAIPYSGLGDDAAVSRVVLMRPCSTTHHFDSDQRYVELEIDNGSDATPGMVQVVAPAAPIWSGPQATAQGAVTAMPGYYMAFLVSTTGSVSTARWVKLQ
jgi:Domain of unknown function (DUF1929)